MPNASGPGVFQSDFAALVDAALPEHARGKPLELWWQDEARIGQQGTLTRVWAERGSWPTAPRDRRASVARGTHAVLTIDGAGWRQTGDKLRVPDNITLLHLPPTARS